MPRIYFLLPLYKLFDTISTAFSRFFYSLTFGPRSDWQKCILLPQNFSVGGDNLLRYTAAERRFFFSFLFLFFPRPSSLMARLNGNSLDWVLRDCAEHAVVMIDKIEWGHRGRRDTPNTLPARTSYWNPKQSGTAYISLFFLANLEK